MAVKIRLKRIGKIRQPYYRVVVVDSRKKRDGRVIEEIGIYHPKNDPSVIQVEGERAQYWLGVGAQPSEAVLALLKLTGDWQQFKGEAAPAPLKVAEPKKSKEDLFNEALKDVGVEPKEGAVTTKKASKKSEKKAAPKAEEPKAEEPKADEPKADEPKADEPKAEESAAPAQTDEG
ncbi:30S ribosomal protein S16 [Solicola gregarius]|uniref:Small ribosomal subunit protein bS16 n=1 Tax=Solicola gregarius TaxID=2908642 RepID=A0AA46TFQ8_9ACTN|nr:30S ribosomal protein S16 [Solicola gregarius]UYM04405.1 30S ribosomal protein S16 [Solicola gregarius]